MCITHPALHLKEPSFLPAVVHAFAVKQVRLHTFSYSSREAIGEVVNVSTALKALRHWEVGPS